MHVLYGEGTTLHTSKRMHFIEEPEMHAGKHSTGSCIRQNVCTSLRSDGRQPGGGSPIPCIRQNVCTSLRTARFATRSQKLLTCIRQNVCTSLRNTSTAWISRVSWSLHTSKRMHFIEDRRKDSSSGRCTLAYVKTYALH